MWRIRHKITRAMAKRGPIIRLPVNVTVDNMSRRKADAKLRGRLGRDPTEEELAVAAQMSVERVALTRRSVQSRPISTATPLLADGAACVQDLLRCENTEEEFEHIEARRDCERLQGAMSALPLMERDIPARRPGLADGEERTLAEIGEVYHLSRERIREPQDRVSRRLRGQLEDAAPAA